MSRFGAAARALFGLEPEPEQVLIDAEIPRMTVSDKINADLESGDPLWDHEIDRESFFPTGIAHARVLLGYLDCRRYLDLHPADRVVLFDRATERQTTFRTIADVAEFVLQVEDEVDGAEDFDRDARAYRDIPAGSKEADIEMWRTRAEEAERRTAIAIAAGVEMRRLFEEVAGAPGAQELTEARRRIESLEIALKAKNTRFDRAKRAFAVAFHPDSFSGNEAEREIRSKIFSAFWSQLEELDAL